MRGQKSSGYKRLLTILCAVAQFPAFGVDVLTFHNDLARTGANTNETILTPANVNSANFGRTFSYTVDGQVYAQPLYVSGVNIPGQGTHNVVFVATEHNSVYAFDADSNTGPNGGLFWHVNLGPTIATPNDLYIRYAPFGDITPEIGITSTPVIDRASGTLYTDAFTFDGTNYFHKIHALNITTGAEQPSSPVLVAPSVSGSGDGNSGGTIHFNTKLQMQRPALTLVGGILYVAYGSIGDNDPYHGWVVGFNASNLSPLANYMFNDTPNGSEAGIWMAGCGLAVDSQTNLYFQTGNGTFDATNGSDYGDCFVKLSTAGRLAVADYFSPSNQATLANGDRDLGSGGILLLPDSVGSSAHPHLMVGCGKEGTVYLVDRDNLGHFNANTNRIVQTLQSAQGGTLASPAYFNGHLYYQGSRDTLRAYSFSNGVLVPGPVKSTNSCTTFHAPTPSVSANGTANGIVWTIQTDTYTNNQPPGPAVLHAYNADNIAQELYNSAMVPGRDTCGGAIKFTTPTIANGRVYVGGQNALTVYGILGPTIATPVITPTARYSSSSINISISEATQGASIYYTSDGSTPNTGSTLYTGPFVLNHSALIQAKAFASGSSSSTAQAFFSIPATVYEQAIASNTPYAFWRFNENAGGTLWDYAPGAHDGSYGTATVPGVAGPRPPIFPGFETNNYAAQTGGASSWATAPALNINNNSVTITAWLYPFGNQGSYTGIFMCRPGTDASGFNFTTGNQLGYTWNNNSSQTWNWLSGVTVPTNQWSFVALVISPGAASVYVVNTNGMKGATNALANSTETFSTTSSIGGDTYSSSRAFNGVIDEVAVFTQALTPSQLNQIYNSVAGSNVVTVVATPVISPTTRYSSSPLTVSFSEATQGATVHYTLDGSTPTASSPTYTGQFVLDHSALVQAKAFASGGASSSVASSFFSIPNTAYETAIASNTPYAFWRFNENALGTLYDYAPGAHDGTYGSATIPGVAGPRPPNFPGFENNNYAAQTGGASSWATAPALNINNNTVTITAWLYPTGNQASYTGIFMCRSGTDASGFNFTTGNQLGYTWNNNSSQTWNWLSGITVPANQWSLAALVISPTATSVYLLNANGMIGATNAVANSTETFSATSSIGADTYSSSRAFNGMIDEVAVFTQALTPTQLKQIYNSVAGSNVVTVVATPVISPTTRYSSSPVTVSVAEATQGASVYYTLDGSTPTTSSTLYTGQFVLNHSALVQAKAFASGGASSSVASSFFSISTTAYEQNVANNSPYAYWRFNETARGTVYDYAPGAHDGSYGTATVPGVAGPRPPTFPGFESNNYAAQTGGASSWPTVPALNINSNTVTITAWLYPLANQASYTGIFMCRPGTDASGFNFTTGNQLGYTWNNNSSLTWSWPSGVTVPNNQWSFVALVISPSAASVYLFNTNGFKGATNAVANSTETFSATTSIAADTYSSSRAFNGMIDEVAVFTHALTPTQLQQLYNSSTASTAAIATTTTSSISAPTDVVLTPVFNGNHLQLFWPAGTLEQSLLLPGPWSSVSNATSPYTVPFADPSSFYRVKVR
jgi:hypothetical protein